MKRISDIIRGSNENTSVIAPIIDEEANRMKVLKEAFDLIDSDGSGKIMPDELGSFFSIQGEDIKEEDLVEIMQQIDVDGEIGLEFDEFVNIMSGVDVADMAVDDIIIKFAEETRKTSRTLQAQDPLWKDMDNQGGTCLFKQHNARMQLAMLIDGTTAQAVVLGLILIDVICIICELLLLGTMCPCSSYPAAASTYSSYSYSSTYSSSYSSSYSSHRQLSGGSNEQCEPGDFEYSHSQHDAHVVLHWISISILLIFGAQILTLVGIYGVKFFTNVFYVLDFVVVFGALFFELTDYFQQGNLLLILMFWRVLRVFHGLISSVELQAKQRESKVAEERQQLHTTLMKSRRALARSKVFYYSYFVKLKNRGVAAADQKFFRKNKGFRTPEAAAISEAVENGVSNALNMELAKERLARSEAEAMFIALYEFLEEHHEHLKIQENILDKKRHVNKKVANEGGKRMTSRERFQLITNALKVKSSFEDSGIEKRKQRRSLIPGMPTTFHLNTHLTSLDEILHMIKTPIISQHAEAVSAAISSHIPFHHQRSSSSSSGSGGNSSSRFSFHHTSSSTGGSPNSMTAALSHIPFVHGGSGSSSGFHRSSSGSIPSGLGHHLVQDVSHAAHGLAHTGSELVSGLSHRIPSLLYHHSSSSPTSSTQCKTPHNVQDIEHLIDAKTGNVGVDEEQGRGDSGMTSMHVNNGSLDTVVVEEESSVETYSDEDTGTTTVTESYLIRRSRHSSEDLVAAPVLFPCMPRLAEEDHNHHSIKMIDLEQQHNSDDI